MATQTSVNFNDLQTAQAGLSRDDIATKANQVVAQPSGSITSEVLSGNPKPLTLPPPTVQTLATGTQDYIASQNESIKTAQQQELEREKADLSTQKNDITSLIEQIGNSSQIKNDLYKKEGVDKAKKDVDEFTSRLEAEQHSNTRRIQAIQKNPEGLFAGGMEQEVNRVNSESLTKQADLAILQNNALRRYSTAAEIADRAVEAKLEPMKAKLEGLKFFYAENKADFDKKDDRAYAELIAKQERDYITQKENITKAFSSGLRNKFINEGGKIYRASDGKEYSDPRSFLQDAGVSSFEEAYQKGLVGDLTFERVADMDFVSQLRTANPMAGISITDTAAQAVQKVEQYQLDHPAAGEGFTLSPGEVRYDSAGNIVATGGDAPDKPLTEAQSKDVAYATRTEEANVYINNLEQDMAKYGAVAYQVAVTAEGTTLGNSFVDDKIRQARQAERNFGTAVLRRESGAAISPSEFATMEKQYFPRPGDDEQTLAQKAQNRLTAINAFKASNPNTSSAQASTFFTKEQLKQSYPQATDEEINSAYDSQGYEVKGMFEKAEPLPYLDPNTFQPIPTKTGGVSVAPVVQKSFPAGSVGGQCGDFVRRVASKFGATYPSLGDSLKSKIAAVRKYGTSLANAKIGSVIVTRENPTYGHVAYIIGRNAKGWIVGESNFKQSKRVSYGRVIPFNSPKLVGVINPTRRG